MAKVIIFGVQDFAQLAGFYLQHFSVNAQYVPETKIFEGLPVIAFESVEETYPPSDFKFFAPMSPSRMNKVRESVYHQIKQKGYEMITYVSSKATVFPGTVIGDNCFILEDNTIQPFTSIGNNVVLWSGNHIGHHGVINDHVSFTSHVVMSGHCVVESFAFFGVNATIRDGIRIAEGSFIAMAAAVTKDTEAWGVYKGNPARKGEVLSKDLDW
jgi:sugar O-acyltransferase (sialic acid O-acetyltransferase NeuD family)